MRLNREMRLPSWARPAVLGLIAAAILAGGCGRSGYQYVENRDDTVFLKIPDDWEIVAEGVVNYAITPDDNPQRLPGENVVPWRVVFNAAPGGAPPSFDHVSGFVEVQPVDRRMRSDLSLSAFFPAEVSTLAEGVEVVRHDMVTAGEASGRRIAWTRLMEDGRRIKGDRLVMTNDLNSVIYTVGLGCSIGCYDANAASIEEVMSTFTVED